MSLIKINIENILNSADSLTKAQKTLSSVEYNISTVKSRIPSNVLSRNGISQQITDINNKINELESKISDIATVSTNSAEKYRKTEIQICNDEEQHIRLIAVNEKAKIINELWQRIPFSTTWTDAIIKEYWQIFNEIIGNKAKKYIDKITAGKTTSDAIVGCYKWIKEDLFGDFDTVKSFFEDVYQEYTYKKPELIPERFEEFFDTIDYCDILVDTAEALRDYHLDGDKNKLYNTVGFELFKKTAKEINKFVDKKTNLKYLGVDKLSQSLLLKTIVEMPKDFVKSVKQYADNGIGTAGSIFVDTTIGAFSEVVSKTASPYYKASTALTYPVVDKICETFGYDLSAKYEKLTGEKGLDAVWKAQKELWVDTVYAGSKEQVSQGIDAFYEGVNWGWNEWKSGIKEITECSKKWFK